MQTLKSSPLGIRRKARSGSLSTFVARRQKGVVLLISLIVLVAMLLAGVALVRSIDTGVLLAQNLSVRADSRAQSSKAFAYAMRFFQTDGALAGTAQDQAQLAFNYSAHKLPADERGIPLIMLKGAAPANVGFSFTDTGLVDTASQNQVEFVIERLCWYPGAANADFCETLTGAFGTDEDAKKRGLRGARPFQPLFRITTRSTGVRGTMTYTQTVFRQDVQ